MIEVFAKALHATLYLITPWQYPPRLGIRLGLACYSISCHALPVSAYSAEAYREPWPVAPANEPPSGWAPVAALAAQPAERARVMVHMPAILKPETTDSHPTFGTAGGVRACLPARPGAAARHGRTGHGPAGPGHWLSGLQGAAPGRMAVVVTVR